MRSACCGASAAAHEEKLARCAARYRSAWTRRTPGCSHADTVEDIAAETRAATAQTPRLSRPRPFPPHPGRARGRRGHPRTDRGPVRHPATRHLRGLARLRHPTRRRRADSARIEGPERPDAGAAELRRRRLAARRRGAAAPRPLLPSRDRSACGRHRRSSASCTKSMDPRAHLAEPHDGLIPRLALADRPPPRSNRSGMAAAGRPPPHARRPGARPPGPRQHLAEPLGRLRHRARGPGGRPRLDPARRPPARRDRGAAPAPARPPAAPPPMSRWSPAPTGAARRPAATR